MSITTQPGAVFTAIAEGLPSGLAATLTFGVRLLPDGTLVLPTVTGSITEYPQGGGVSNYEATRTMPIETVAGESYETAWPDDLVDQQEEIVVEPLSGGGPPASELPSYFQRLVAGRAAAARVVFEDGEGEPADAGGVTVKIVRDDGTVVASARPAAPRDGVTGGYGVQLSSSELASLDLLTLVWTGTVAGEQSTETTLVEVCGGRHFTLARMKKLRGMDTGYSNDELDDGRTGAEEALEHECRVAFVPRYARITLDGTSNGILILRHRRVIRIRSITLDGTPMTSDDLAALKLIKRAGVIQGLCSTFRYGPQSIEVVYEHGWPTTPGRIENASRLLGRSLVFESQIDPRVVRTRDEGGHETFYSAPGVRGIVFGIPEVEGAVTEYSEPDLLL